MCVQGVEPRHTEEEFKELCEQVQQLGALRRKLEELDQRTR